AFVRGFGLDDRSLDKTFNEDLVDVFREDVAILNAQQAMMTLKPGANEININVDAGPAASRNILDEMMEAER
ncbi:MAG: aromatic ring-hydroxylating dioxygenase subunit alpha, partial [Rhodospirillales bacterium]|nr:aromatic ring-hydroxylating dioxygenase subunit alpha [Rhodospirillales bacterium]